MNADDGSERAGDPPEASFSGPLRELYADYTTESIKERIDAALGDGGVVGLGLLLEVSTLRLPQINANREVRRLAQENFRHLERRYEEEHPEHSFYISAVLQVVVLLDSSTSEVVINFGTLPIMNLAWEGARDLVHEANALGERSKLWIHNEEDQIAHAQRAYGVAILAFDALEHEAWRRLEPEEVTEQSGREFDSELASARAELERAEQLFVSGAQQTSQSEYMKGVVAGGAIVAVVSALISVAIFAAGAQAYALVALPAGGLGAMISVMHRMHSGSLALDFRSTKQRLLSAPPEYSPSQAG